MEMTTTRDEVWGGEIRRGWEAAAIDRYQDGVLAHGFNPGPHGECASPIAAIRLTGKKWWTL